MKKEFGILVDSTACGDKAYFKAHDIYVIPLSLSDGANKVYADDGVELPLTELLRRLDNKEVFKTATTTLGKLTITVEDMLEKYEKVIFVPMSEGLSSQYQQSMIIRADHPNNFFVVKSSCSGCATEFLLPHLIEWMKAKLPMDEVLFRAEAFYYRTSTYFSCEDMSGMIKGGRVSHAILKIINWFNRKPIIYVDSKNELGGVGKNYQSIVPRMITMVKKSYKNDLQPSNIKNIGIYDTGYPKEKMDFILDTLANGFSFPKEKIIIRELPSTIVAHTHRGSYGFTVETDVMRKNKKFN